MRWARPLDRSTAGGRDGTALPQPSADPWGWRSRYAQESLQLRREDKGMKEWGRGGEIYIDTLKTTPFHLPPSLRGIFYRLKSSWTIKCLNPVILLVLLSFSTWHLASIIILISIHQFHFSLLDLPHLPTTQFPLLTLTVHFRQQFRERLLYSPSMTNIWRHHLEKVSVDKNIYNSAVTFFYIHVIFKGLYSFNSHWVADPRWYNI